MSALATSSRQPLHNPRAALNAEAELYASVARLSIQDLDELDAMQRSQGARTSDTTLALQLARQEIENQQRINNDREAALRLAREVDPWAGAFVGGSARFAYITALNDCEVIRKFSLSGQREPTPFRNDPPALLCDTLSMSPKGLIPLPPRQGIVNVLRVVCGGVVADDTFTAEVVGSQRSLPGSSAHRLAPKLPRLLL